MSLEEGSIVTYIPDGSKGKVVKVKNHVLFKCADVEFIDGPQAGTTSGCRCSNLRLETEQEAEPRKVTWLDTIVHAPCAIAHAVTAVAAVAAHAPCNAMNQQPLSTLTPAARTCAFVANACYKYPDREPMRPSHIPNHIDGVAGARWSIDLDASMSSEKHAVYVIADGPDAGCPILGYTGTRFGMPEFHEDKDPDVDIALCGAIRMVLEDRSVFDIVREVADKYEGKRLYLAGHSLGGTRALVAALGGDGSHPYMDVSGLVHEVHVFNPGSGIQPHGLGGGRIRASILIHRIFGDMISVTNFPSDTQGKATLVVYSKHPDANGTHAVDNFCLPPPSQT